MNEESGCRVSILTPSGRGAVASVAVIGERCGELVDRFFEPAGGAPLSSRPVGGIAFGRWVEDGHVGEEVVACRVGDRRLEVHCHGGSMAAESIIESLTRSGCRRVSWRDLVGDEGRSPEALALIDLTEARTRRTAAVLLDQHRGALRRELDEILRSDRGEEACGRIRDLWSLAPVGLHLTRPWRVVLSGPPNVGKSSLMNAMLGFERAIVDRRPGTTRDVVSAQTAIDGWPVELRDTAGVRDAGNRVEASGVSLALNEAAAADLVLRVVDLSGSVAETDQRLFRADRCLVVGNKSDLPPGGAATRADVRCSATTGHGIEALVRAVGRRLVPRSPPPGAAVPFRVEHVDALEEALARAERGDLAAARAALSRILNAV